MYMYQKEVNIEKLAEYANSDWPQIYFFKEDSKWSEGCVDAGGLMSGEYLENVGLDKSILDEKNAEFKLCKYLLDNNYVLFISLGMVESMEEYGKKGKYYIDDIEVTIDVDELFRKPKIFETENEVEFFTQWDEKYLDETVYRVCSNDCPRCFYCLDDEFEYTIAFPISEDGKFNGNLLNRENYLKRHMQKLNHNIKFLENHSDLVRQVENEFRGYTNGYYGVFVKRIDGKNIMDYGYLSEVGGPVCFVGPSLDFYHLEDIESDDDVKKTFIKLTDEADIY